ncbi:hypothetical protein HaLaN_20512 [Haematococcus lacustris]|uniref:Uncharacterized protein n=1 Tax=Haematococcus lacustris TaxID=44745 RepID=A0A699ZTE9_HAELA|nr:hypothetical protein HaLaN_20512 [Haematococcus lacustris]
MALVRGCRGRACHTAGACQEQASRANGGGSQPAIPACCLRAHTLPVAHCCKECYVPVASLWQQAHLSTGVRADASTGLGSSGTTLTPHGSKRVTWRVRLRKAVESHMVTMQVNGLSLELEKLRHESDVQVLAKAHVQCAVHGRDAGQLLGLGSKLALNWL